MNLARAIRIASQAHELQTDFGGNAYILHPIRLMMKVGPDEEVMTMAVLHDTVEDSKEWTIERLREEGFSERVLAALTLLTHRPEDSYEEYIKKIATNRDAIIVKMADLTDNSDITRLKGIKDKDIARMQKYHKAYTYLKGVLKHQNEIYGISQ